MKTFLKILIFVMCLCCLNSQELVAQSITTSNNQMVRIFKAGAFNLDQDKLVGNCEYNVTSWVQHYVKSKNRNEFYKAYGELIKAINEGRISRDYNRTFHDSKGLLHNKGKGYDGLGVAVEFVNNIIDNMIRCDNYIK